MNKENSKVIVIIVLAVLCLSFGTVVAVQNAQMRKAQTVAVVTPIATKPSAVEPRVETAVVPEATPSNGECARAKVVDEGAVNADNYSIAIDGKTLSQSEITGAFGRITGVQVSSDCKSVAWVVAPYPETDQEGNYIKPEKIRTMVLGQNTITDFTLPAVGPAELVPFKSGSVLVRLGAPILSDADIPSEESLSGTFYVLEVGTGKTTLVGGPFLAVSPDLQKNIKKVGKDIVLQNTVANKTITLAKGDGEFAYDFVFSPDSATVAYLWFEGKRGDIFTVLFRPIATDDQTILSAKLVAQPVDGNTKPIVLISGGYGINNGWLVDRWLSPFVVEYTQPENALREYSVDLSTPSRASIKKELIDIGTDF